MLHTHFILDTDPGQDDAVAILFALGASHQLVLDAICVVAGNVPLPLTTRNARMVCDWAGREDIPIYAGCDEPLVRKLVTAEGVHGGNGLEGIPFHSPRTALQDIHAVDAFIDRIRNAAKDEISLCAIGPLTNIAMALKKAPDIRKKLKQIVMMGGTYFEAGNVSPVAEFNFFADPQAAAVVFSSGIPIVVLPLDVTHKVCSNQERIAALRSLPNFCGPIVADILTSYGRYDRERFGLQGGPLHDPCAIAWLIEPDLFAGKDVYVAIETSSELTMGESVVDWWMQTDNVPNAYWITKVDDERFFSLLRDSLANLP